MTNQQLATALTAARETAQQAKASTSGAERTLALEVGRHAHATGRALERWMAARLSRATEESNGSR